jgi:hypothetical protein
MKKLRMIDEKISEKNLYRLNGILAVRVYRRAKRVDVNFSPYWKVVFDKIRKRSRVFEMAKLLGHNDEN